MPGTGLKAGSFGLRASSNCSTRKCLPSWKALKQQKQSKTFKNCNKKQKTKHNCKTVQNKLCLRFRAHHAKMQGVLCYNCSKRVPCHVLFANQAQFKIMEKLFSDLPHVSSRAHGSTSSKLSSNCDMPHVGSKANTKVKSSKRVSNMGHVCSEACKSSNDCTQALLQFATHRPNSSNLPTQLLEVPQEKTLQDVKYTTYWKTKI